MKAVEVTWLDTMQMPLGWRREVDYIAEATYDSLVHYTVGYLIDEQPKWILIAQSYGKTAGGVSECVCIPRCSIIKTRKIK